MAPLDVLGPALVTGATGLIGGEILRALVAAERDVSAVVRAGQNENPTLRIEERFRRSGCEINGELANIDILAGDVRVSGLGLATDVAARVRSRVEIIIHAAAETSFIRDRDCGLTNVQGMRHLIEFARGCFRDPLIVYFGTAASSGVCTHKCLCEEEGCQPDRPHHNDYTRSKAIAEHMLRSSGLRVLVVRPSIVLSAGLPDPAFARSMLWFIPLLNRLDCVPVDPSSRLDTVPISYVTDSTLSLLRLPGRRNNCYHISAGSELALTCGELAAFLNDYYQREQPLQLVPPSGWTPAVHRRFIRTREQRKVFSMIRPYLPFLNMDVVYDNTRLREELGDHALKIQPMTSYLGELLAMISYEKALREALNP